MVKEKYSYKPGFTKFTRVKLCNIGRHKAIELACNSCGVYCSNVLVPGSNVKHVSSALALSRGHCYNCSKKLRR